jgi:N-acetylneuraminic acid mutarotase
MDVSHAAAAVVLMASLGWERLPPITDSEGFAGCFAGVAGGALVVAGGANFPAGRPWEGGKKTWHDRVFVLEHGGSGWRVAGRLPRPLAYGVSVTHEGRVICCGGSDDSRHHDSVFALAWDGTALRVEPLPSLPRPLAQHAGAVVGRHLVVGGGTETPADTTIKVNWADWQSMASGQLDGMTAFMTGKLKVEGDMSNAMFSGVESTKVGAGYHWISDTWS